MSKKYDPREHLNIVINPDGTCTRLLDIPSKKPEPNPAHGAPTASKDIILNPQHKTSLRIFRPNNLPSNDNTIARLPIIFHFHSSCWVLFDATAFHNHQACDQMASELTVIVISVNYRLAPEHRLPAQYDDCLEAILWVQKQAVNPDGEPWLRHYADFSRCYLYGSGNGANMAFNAALRALGHDLSPLTLDGYIFYQPVFGGMNRTQSELQSISDPLVPLPAQDLLWELALPKGVDRDHRYCNPMIDVPLKNKAKLLGRCLVIGYGRDAAVDRQQEFVSMLVGLGVRVDARFDEAGFIGIEHIDPRRVIAVLNLIREFIIC